MSFGNFLGSLVFPGSTTSVNDQSGTCIKPDGTTGALAPPAGSIAIYLQPTAACRILYGASAPTASATRGPNMGIKLDVDQLWRDEWHAGSHISVVSADGATGGNLDIYADREE